MNNIDWYHSTSSTFDWTVTQDASGTYIFQPVVDTTNPSGAGNDVIYAGDGADHVWAGAGDDAVYGEGGNDVITGDAGNDVRCEVLFGREKRDAVNDLEWRMRA